MGAKKILLIFGLTVIVSLGAFFIVDIHLMRGYHTIFWFYRELFEDFDGSITYNVSRNADGTFDLELQNNDFAYYPLVVYRNEETFYDLNDTVLFAYASRLKIRDSGKILFASDGGFDCGTGLGEAFIRPFEKFKLRNVKLHDLISDYTVEYVADSIAKFNISKDSIEQLEWELYLPIFSLGEEKTRVYSNKFLVGDLLTDYRKSILKDRW